jgi:hypothetical protein
VNPETADKWKHPPYSGHFDGERIWGRGTADDKNGLIAILSVSSSVVLLAHPDALIDQLLNTWWLRVSSQREPWFWRSGLMKRRAVCGRV